MRVGLFCPSFDGRVCAALSNWATDETHQSVHLVGRLVVVAHLPLHIVRPKLLAELEHLDAVIMVDSDQAPDLLPRSATLPLVGLELVEATVEVNGGSVIDQAVAQYVSVDDPDRILVGVTCCGDGQPNIKRDEAGHIVEAGAGFMFVPRAVYARLPERAWIDGSIGEDIAFSRACQQGGIRFEELRGVRMLHWPIRYSPLAWDTPW